MIIISLPVHILEARLTEIIDTCFPPRALIPSLLPLRAISHCSLSFARMNALIVGAIVGLALSRNYVFDGINNYRLNGRDLRHTGGGRFPSIRPRPYTIHFAHNAPRPNRTRYSAWTCRRAIRASVTSIEFDKQAFRHTSWVGPQPPVPNSAAATRCALRSHVAVRYRRRRASCARTRIVLLYSRDGQF